MSTEINIVTWAYYCYIRKFLIVIIRSYFIWWVVGTLEKRRLATVFEKRETVQIKIFLYYHNTL